MMKSTINKIFFLGVNSLEELQERALLLAKDKRRKVYFVVCLLDTSPVVQSLHRYFEEQDSIELITLSKGEILDTITYVRRISLLFRASKSWLDVL